MKLFDAKLDKKLKFVKEVHKEQKVLKTKVAKVEPKVSALENYSRRNNGSSWRNLSGR